MIIKNPNLGACTVDYKPLGDLGLSLRRSSLFRVINTAVKTSTGRDLPVAPLPPPPPPKPVAVIPPPPAPPPAPAPAPAPAPVLPQAGSETEMVQLSADTAALKEYFDVGVYRNILDMLLTFEGVLKRYGQAIANELNCVQRQSRISCGSVNGLPACTPPAGYGNGEPWMRIGSGSSTLQLATAIGYAASKIGPKNKDEAQIYAQQQIKAAGLSAGVPTGFFEVPDLLNLARTIEYEMNRVRLPVPHNFRQIANAIQGREYKICSKWWSQIPGLPSKPSLQQWKYGAVRGSYFKKFDEVFSARYINGIELLGVYKNLRNAINAMRTGIRKEIDAANLAKKVQEETIRAEQEALISRQAAEEQARQRELEILAEKKAAYERELAEAEKVRLEMAQAREELTAELEQLNEAREAAATPVEVQAVEEKAAEVAEAVVQAAEIEQDMASNLATSAQAAQNLNYQMRNVQADLITQREQAMQAGIPTKKPVNLTPIILTVAAGFFLS